MYEHEFFIELFNNTGLKGYSKVLKIKPKAFIKSPMEDIPIKLIKNELIQAFANSYKKSLPKHTPRLHIYNELQTLGDTVMKRHNLPAAKGEELLAICGSRVDIPDPVLLGYFYLNDPDLYKEKMAEWLKMESVPERIFREYAKEPPEKLLITSFNPQVFIDAEYIPVIDSILQNIEVTHQPEEVTAEIILNYSGALGETMKLLHFYLSNQGKEHLEKAIYQSLLATLICWCAIKEKDRFEENNNTLLEISKELATKLGSQEKDLNKVREKLNKATTKNTDLQQQNQQLAAEKKRITQQLTSTNKTLGKHKKELETLKKDNKDKTAALDKAHTELNNLYKLCDVKSTSEMTTALTFMQHALGGILAVLPDPKTYLIVIKPHWKNAVPSIVPKSCIVDIKECTRDAWCQEHSGKTIYLHRQSFGTAKQFEDVCEHLTKHSLNIEEVSALDETEWIKELIRKGVR